VYAAPEAKNDSYGNRNTMSLFRANVPMRSLIRFDLQSLAMDQAIEDSAILVYLSAEYHDRALELWVHPLTSPWSQSESSWVNAKPGSPWHREGGDYDDQEKFKIEIAAKHGTGWVALRSSKLTQWITHWKSNPQNNHGVVVLVARDYLGAYGGGASMKQFATTEHSDPTLHPKLLLHPSEKLDLVKLGFGSAMKDFRKPYQLRLKQLAGHEASMNSSMIQTLKQCTVDLKNLEADRLLEVEALEDTLNDLCFTLIKQKSNNQTILAWESLPWQPLEVNQIPLFETPQLHVKVLRECFHELSTALTNTTRDPQPLKIAFDTNSNLPLSHVTLRMSYWVKAKTIDSTTGVEGSTWVDDALPRIEVNEAITLKPRETRRLWLTVDTHGLAAVHYLQIIVISDVEGKTLTQIPVRVEVSTAKLDLDDDLYVYHWAYLDRPLTASCMEFAVADLKRHGQNTFITGNYAGPKVNNQGEVTKPADFQIYNDWLDLVGTDVKKLIFFWWWDDDGTRATFGNNVDFMSSAWHQVFEQWMSEWALYMQSRGFDYSQFAMLPFDESYENPVLGMTEYQAFQKVASAIKDCDPQIEVVMNPVKFASDDRQTLLALDASVDIWMPHYNLLKTGDHHGWPGSYTQKDKNITMEWFASRQKMGKSYWSWVCDAPMKALDVNDYYQHYVWLSWQLGIKGVGVWSYNDVRGASVWDDFDSQT